MGLTKQLRPGDEVVIIAGNDKGKNGKILSRSNERVVVEGVNVRKKHLRKTQQTPGRIVDIECAIHISNVKPFVAGKAVKLRARINKKNEKELYFLSENKEVLHRSVKKPKS